MKHLPLWLLALLVCGQATSFASPLSLEQLNHRSFTTIEGAPTSIRAFAQTTDGTLWLGTLAGLWRFDGQRFVAFPQPSDPALPSSNITALEANPDGSLWIGFRTGGVGLLSRGRFTHYTPRDGVPGGLIRNFARDQQGTLWVAANQGLGHLSGGRWQQVAKETISRALAVMVDRSGTLWIETGDSLWSKSADEAEFHKVLSVKIADQQFSPQMTLGADGTVWTVVEGSLIAVRHDLQSRSFSSQVSAHPGLGPPIFIDDTQNMWLGRESLHRSETPEFDRFEQFGRSDALSGGFVFSLFQDREKNIWVGTNTGLDRFSPPSVVKLPLPWCSGAQIPAAGENGTLWVACPIYGKAHGTLTEIRDGRVVSHQDTEQFTTGYGDGSGDVWFAGPEAIGHLEGGRIITSPVPARAAGPETQGILPDGTGALWVSIAGKGLFRVVNGQWYDYGNLNALPRKSPYVESLDDQGGVWFGYLAGEVVRIEGHSVHLYGKQDGVDVGPITAICPHGNEVWIAGERGLLRFDGQKFAPVVTSEGVAIQMASGIVFSPEADMWLNAKGGIKRITRQELSKAVKTGNLQLQADTFDHFDGVPGAPVQTRPTPSAVATSDGRVWFNLTGGLVSIDTTRIQKSSPPPPVTIWSVMSGGRRIPNSGGTIRLPIHTTQLEIDYTAGTLTTPEHVLFRYKLEGSDSDWQYIGNRHEARYTNLGPGQYTFRVMATNRDGVWTTAATALNLSIEPAFYQTLWFRFVCATALIWLLYLLYQLRLRHVTAQVKDRLEARLSERERIARELHDTLLQAIQGLIWKFETVALRATKGELHPELLRQTLDRAEATLKEGRERVKDLRGVAGDGLSLGQAIAQEGEQLAMGQQTRFQTSVEGTHRELHPIVHEEVLFIAREALRNAFRHAQAQVIEAEVSYAATALHLRVRDDGCGIGANVIEDGQPGHFGLLGMHERARKMHAQMDIWSKPAAGTEIDLRVPAHVAYKAPIGLLQRVRWIWSSRGRAEI